MGMMRSVARLVLVALVGAGCGGARHRKVAGPPPQYELAEDPDAGAAWRTVTAPGIAGDAGLR